ncbi:MAG: hypothetical protein LCI00_31970 [Chloroflexi bacterium]|nr:hypothetical protein [Chloroflexota bacterium]MCC6891987.1 hypothetical protein [Anaerolineae bacterium]
MDQRDERIMVSLAEQFAPALLQLWDKRGTFDDRLPRLARGLASYNILILMADQPYSLQSINQNVGTLIQDWANLYLTFYKRLCQDLFPSFNQVSVHSTDDRWPVMIYLKGTATPVIQRMAGFITPYIVQRQFSPTVSEVELLGLMDLILDELEAGNLPRDVYKHLRTDCIDIVKQILATPVHQLAVTDFDRNLFSDSQRLVPVAAPPPPTVPEAAPSTLPFQVPPVRQADTQQLMTTDVMPTPPGNDKPLPPKTVGEQARFSFPNPLAGLRRDKGNTKKLPPPVPPIPDKES